MAFIIGQGIRTIVTLTEGPVAGLAGREGLQSLHFPIPDMGFPTPRNCAEICAEVAGARTLGGVLLHCRAGLGRTGMIAACCLVEGGEQPEEALLQVRTINANYVQTRSQEQFIRHFGAYLRPEPASP